MQTVHVDFSLVGASNIIDVSDTFFVVQKKSLEIKSLKKDFKPTFFCWVC